MLKHTFVSLCLNAGIMVGKQSKTDQVFALIRRLHPILPGVPLIRIGDTNDGTYLIPDDLSGIVACFSPGVSNRATFEEFFLERGVPCFLADASVEGPPITSPLLQFERKFLGATNDENTTRMDDWVDEKAPSEGDLLLQMDIEGAEWTVLLDTSPKTLRRFRIISLELHNLERLFDSYAFPIIRSVLEKLTAEFDVVHNHPNNYGWFVKCGSLVVPRSLEMTFLRKDRVRSRTFAREFPHPLDIKNAAELPDIVLPPQWFSSEQHNSV